MQFKAITLAALALVVPGALTTPTPASVPVTYDNTYDNPTGSLFNVACSNGDNGLLTKGFTDFQSLPPFPYIGGAAAVEHWDSESCGSCWKLQYCDKPPVYVIAVDNAAIIQLGQPAFDQFAGEEGAKRGSVNATAVEVDPSFCGLC